MFVCLYSCIGVVVFRNKMLFAKNVFVDDALKCGT